MKQHISVDDLNKLSDEQKERLREWWVPKHDEGDHVCVMIEDEENGTKWLQDLGVVHEMFESSWYPLLSVGQMIQFIQEKKPLLKGISKNRFNKWFVNIDNGMLGYKDELCDALWDTVKQLLKG